MDSSAVVPLGSPCSPFRPADLEAAMLFDFIPSRSPVQRIAKDTLDV